tara:strand:- start:4366 stop:4899 length:534 start_codon:yes stop_codon:yes gene_type:complete
MSGKACGMRENNERKQFMLGSNFLNKKPSKDNVTNQIVNAIKQNRQILGNLQNKTEQIEKSLLMQRSLHTESEPKNINITKLESSFQEKLNLISGEFNKQMGLMKDYIRLLEKKIRDLENKIIQKTPEIPEKKESPKSTVHEPKKETKKEIKKPEKKTKIKKPEKEKKNVTLEIKEK